MSHFAKIENSIVTTVIVAEQAFVDTLPGVWVKTSYNTRGGVHYGPNGLPDSAKALRANFAGKGFTYDAGLDVFYAPKPSPLHELDDLTYLWKLKAEYAPLVTVKTISPLLAIPNGIANSDITVNQILINDKTLIFFPNATSSPGVYCYSLEQGLLLPIDHSKSVIKLLGDDAQVWKFTDEIWTAHPVT